MSQTPETIYLPEMDGEKETPKYKFGVVYLSYIPDGLNVKILREILSQFGEVGRVYLEPEENNRKKYVEGWVEFKKKRVAKLVAETLNGTPLEYGRKRSRLNGQIWSLKYLHKFKWAQLTDQLVQVRALKEQKRRSEMSHAKKQAHFYQDLTERFKRKKSKSRDNSQVLDEQAINRIKSLEAKQNKPIRGGNELAVAVDDDLLSNIFKKVT